MTTIISALMDPTLSFLRNAVLAGILSSILFGILGAIVTVRRVASLAGAISHAVLGGIGMALYLSTTGIVPGLPPVAGALAFAVIAAIIIGLVSLKAKQREDTVINAIWAIGMSLGVLFMARTPGYTDPSSYLFGNILLVSTRDLWLLAALDIIVLVITWRFYPQIKLSSFDEEYARVRGINTHSIFFIILTITAIAIVLLQTFVGIVMVIAMLTLPAGTAGFRAKSLWLLMGSAIGWALFFSLGGLAAGWHFDLPVGAMAVVIAGLVFLVFSAHRALTRKGNKVEKKS